MTHYDEVLEQRKRPAFPLFPLPWLPLQAKSSGAIISLIFLLFHNFDRLWEVSRTTFLTNSGSELPDQCRSSIHPDCSLQHFYRHAVTVLPEMVSQIYHIAGRFRLPGARLILQCGWLPEQTNASGEQKVLKITLAHNLRISHEIKSYPVFYLG